MSKDFCMECGVLLSAYSNVCPVCGYENGYELFQDMPVEDEMINPDFDDFVTDDQIGL